MAKLPHILKTRYKGNEPVRQYCSPTERNRINNFITGLRGVNCRVELDPNDLRNCRIIVDGSSDIDLPPDAELPWEISSEDQFLVSQAREPQDVIVLSSTYGGTMVDNTGDVQWPGTPPTPPLANLTPSNPFELEYGVINTLYAQHWYNPPNPYSNVGHYTGTDDPSGLPSPPDLSQIIATIEVDENGQITNFVQEYEKPDTGFNVSYTDPTPLIGFQVRGGVWQEVIGNETYIYVPEDDDVTWGLVDSDNSGKLSRVYRGEGDLWAVLDKTSATPAFYFSVLATGVDPTWADGETWLKIASTAYEYETPGDDTTPVAEVLIEQHHQGGLHSNAPAEPKACASMCSCTTTWSTGVVPFGVLNHETNDSILDVDLANNKTIVKEGFVGIYSLKMQGRLLVKLADSPGHATVRAVVRKGGSDTECQAQMYVSKPTVVATEYFVNEFSASIDEFVDASSGDVDLDVYVYVSVDGSDTAALTECRLDVHLIELTDSAT